MICPFLQNKIRMNQFTIAKNENPQAAKMIQILKANRAAHKTYMNTNQHSVVSTRDKFGKEEKRRGKR